MTPLILAADIGGTKTLLQIAQIHGDIPLVIHSKRYSSLEFSDFTPLLHAFFAETHIPSSSVTSACLAIAGPVHSRHAQVTNLPWRLDADELQSIFSIARIEFINDFSAVGLGIPLLPAASFIELQTGTSIAQAPCAVIGAGTGLGTAALIWNGIAYQPLPSEGGHVDFAPQNAVQMALLTFLQQQYGHVSWERVVSGMGLVNIYEFLCASNLPSQSLQNSLMAATDPAATLTEFALKQQDALAQQALDIFVACYGAQVGNVALTYLARGGVYIAGGIAAKLVTRLQQPDFMQAFHSKGRFHEFLQSLPVKIVMDNQVGLHGAASVALANLHHRQ